MTSSLVLLDNTILTNFALVGRPDLVVDLWDAACATTTAVIAEYEAGVISHGLPANIWNTVTSLPLDPGEQALADQLPPRLGSGRSKCDIGQPYCPGLPLPRYYIGRLALNFH